MTKIFILTLLTALTIVIAVLLIPSTVTNENIMQKQFYIGVTYCGNSTAEAKMLIDRVKTYTNLFVLQSFNFSRNENATKEICDYAVAKNLNIILNLATYNDSTFVWQLPLLKNAKTRWGNHFLGVYYDDEPGGIQLDYNWTEYFTSTEFSMISKRFPNWTLCRIYQETQTNSSTPRDYSREARWFTNMIRRNLRPEQWKTAGITSFTSDYALYWWDYKGGYDVILAQLGWNHSITQQIALIRGAARVQNKTWGTIITWKYDKPPYIDNSENIYQQILTSYRAGAKYVIIFNYPKIGDNPYGILTDEHFEVLKKFWNSIITKQDVQTITDLSQAEAALMLPNNYAWGMRHPDDKIWGFWGPDEKSHQIWNLTQTLLERYGLKLDIIYEDPAFSVTDKYARFYYWNQTV
ncbi:MAG: hypothetical protein QXU99_05875 [Candidatus Bathyarchaeia archaeon]